jgi:hypothetical protein
LNEINIKQEQFNIIITQFEYLTTQNILNSEIEAEIETLKSRFTNLINSLDKIEERYLELEKVISLSSKADILANKIRNLSALSARRFMAEEDDRSLQSAINDQKSIIDEMKLFENEIEDIRNSVLINCENNTHNLPIIFNEKILNTQETIRQSLSEEFERRSSLLDIKKSTELKQNKLDCLNYNIELIQSIFNQKVPDDYEEAVTTNLDSKSQEIETPPIDLINITNSEYSIYLNCLSKCKKIIQNSKELVNELKLPLSSTTSPILFFGVTSVNRSSPAPSYHDYHELREIELKLDSFSHQLESQIDIFEANLAKNAKLEKKFEKIDKSLNDLVEKFHIFNLSFLNNSGLNNNNESIEILELENDQLKIDLDQCLYLKKE